MESRYRGTNFEWYISYYSEIRKRLETAEHYYRIGLSNDRKKRYGTARRNYLRARRSVNRAPIYTAFRYKYNRALGRRASKKLYEEARPFVIGKAKQPVTVTKAPLSRYVILPVEENQGLRHAVMQALQPDEKTTDRLIQSLGKAKIATRELATKYSSKKKKNIRYWKTVHQPVAFRKGIYLVKLNKNLNVVAVKQVRSVELDPSKYQNQQYLKNSYFGPQEKHRNL